MQNQHLVYIGDFHCLPTPEEELRRITDPELRKDALRIRREVDTARIASLAETEAE